MVRRAPLAHLSLSISLCMPAHDDHLQALALRADPRLHACHPAPSRSLRSIATRWDKFTKNYLAALKLVAVRIWLRSNEFTIQGLSMHQRRIVSLTLCFWFWVAKAELSTARLIRSNRLITFLEASVTTRRAALY